MSVVMTCVKNVKFDSEQFQTSSIDHTGVAGEKISAAIPALSTNYAVSIPNFTPSDLLAFWISADQACSIFLITGTGADEIQLDAGNSWLWEYGQAWPWDDAEEVTGLEVTCTALTNIVGRFVQ